MKHLRKFALVLSLVSAVSASAETSPTMRSATSGAVAGAAVGAVVGHNSKSRDAGKGAAIGAAGGFILGTIYGQSQENRQVVCPPNQSGTVVRAQRHPGYSEPRFGSDTREQARREAIREAEHARRRYEYALESLRRAQADLELSAAKVRAAEGTLRELGY